MLLSGGMLLTCSGSTVSVFRQLFDLEERLILAQEWTHSCTYSSRVCLQLNCFIFFQRLSFVNCCQFGVTPRKKLNRHVLIQRCIDI